MRELKYYFCTYDQTQELIKLGLKDYKSLMCWNKEQGVLKLGNSNVWTISRAPLRAQALDYFRELGYSAGLRGTTPYNWYLIERSDKSIMSIKSGNYVSHVHCESALIDKLIELEKEARNGK